ncbi:MAG TPA: type II toxin-antitoxin system VapC family toxin [Gaiellaceae bacterium]
MIVLDASAAVHLLLGTEGAGDWVAERVAGEDRRVPQLFEYEVLSALRAAEWRRDVGRARAASAVDDLASLRVRRHPPQPLLGRIWDLRKTLTVYDASYVALAEALDAPLVTADGRLERAHGHGATIELCPV